MAAAVIARRASLAEYTDEFVRRPEVGELMRRVTVVTNENYDPVVSGASVWDQVTIDLVSGERMAWGNAVIGLRNPIAPPVEIRHDATGKSVCDFHLGAAYEGPPGHVHGGVAALVLDHLLGEAASDGINPRLTGTISFRYVRATRLGRLHAEAATTHTDGVKTYAVGHLADDEGITVEAEGVFIQPRWARNGSE